MDHNYYKERISAYSDHALPPYEQMAVEGHLATCAECRSSLENIKKLGDFINQQGNLGEDDYFEKEAQAIEERLGLAQTTVTSVTDKRSWRGLGWKLTAAAASIALVGILAFYTKDSIWQKTDQPPAMQSPGIQKSAEPPGDSQVDQEMRKPVIPAPQFESDARNNAGQGKKTVKTEVIDSLRDRLPEEDVLAPEVDIKLDESQSNYKDAPRKIAPTVPPMDSLPKEDKLAKPVELQQSDTAAVPVPRADQMLESVAGAKAMGDSGVVIRGGRAGEMEYSIDSAPSTDTLERAIESRKKMVVKGARDIMSKPDASGLVSESSKQLKLSSAQPVDSLDYWRRVRASLGEITFRADGKPAPAMLTAQPDSTGRQPEKIGVAKLDSFRGKAAGLITKEADVLPKSESIILRACFNIARLSSDSTEIADVRRVLFKAASEPKSPYRSLAQSYLDSLGVK